MHKVSRRAGGAEPNRRWPDVVPFAELRSGVNRHSSSRLAGAGKSASSKDWRKCSRETGAVDSMAPWSAVISRPLLPFEVRSAG
jgi:hypothetical protein